MEVATQFDTLKFNMSATACGMAYSYLTHGPGCVDLWEDHVKRGVLEWVSCGGKQIDGIPFAGKYNGLEVHEFFKRFFQVFKPTYQPEHVELYNQQGAKSGGEPRILSVVSEFDSAKPMNGQVTLSINSPVLHLATKKEISDAFRITLSFEAGKLVKYCDDFNIDRLREVLEPSH